MFFYYIGISTHYMETTISKRASKFRREIVVISGTYTTEMSEIEKYRAYQGWAEELKEREENLSFHKPVEK